MPSRIQINLAVILIVGFGLQVYYKLKFLLIGVMTMDDIFNWTLPLEILFGLLLATIVVMGHDIIVNSLRKCFVERIDQWKRWIIQFSIAAVYSVLAAVFFSYVYWNWIMGFPMTAEYYFDFAILGFMIPIIVNGFSESFYFYSQWENEKESRIALQRENAMAKFEILKNQVSPHFLFNSFNTLAVLIRENMGEASSFLTELSKVYRHILEYKDEQVISLESEIESLRAYIHLMKYRYGDSFKVGFEMKDFNDHYVPPLTLQILIENALKHNSFNYENPLNISLKQIDSTLLVTNDQRQIKASTSMGTGLKNLSKRYAYLTNEKVVVHSSNGMFKVTIPLLNVESL